MSETDGNKNKELMNALNSVKKVNVGDVVNAEILAIDDNKQLIVGIEDSGVEGVVPPRELSSKPIKNINDDFKVGDKIKVLVVTKIGGDKEGGSYVLSIRRVQSRKVWDKIQAKANAKETITVPVSRAVRGGLVVDAGVRGFIPASMITDHFVRDLNQFNGKDLECKIIEVVPEKNRLILSHRAIVEKKDKAARDKVMSEINEGDTVEGKVARLTNFGAFIDLGGIDGLVHISQISYAHVNKPSDVLKVGQEVKVKVMSIDEDRDRISLSMKALEPEPWDNIEEKAPKGSIITGTVKRLVDFGAFVEVTPGVEGLLHISQISHQHVNTPSDVLKVGQEVKVKVLDVQPENHRLSLSMRALEPNPDDNDKKTPKHNVSDHSKTNAPDEENGFTLGDIVGNELKKEENNKKNK